MPLVKLFKFIGSEAQKFELVTHWLESADKRSGTTLLVNNQFRTDISLVSSDQRTTDDPAPLRVRGSSPTAT